LPRSAADCEVNTTLDYSPVRLNSGEFLLPRSARQRFIGRDGLEFENSYVFSSCRDFQAQSSISFGSADRVAPAPASAAAGAPAWPEGLAVAIDVTTPIDSDTAAAGDRIEGRLAAPIYDAEHRELAPQGALAVGRLMRVAVHHQDPRRVTVMLFWETLQLNGAPARLKLTPHRNARSMAATAAPAGLRRRGTEFVLPPRNEEAYAVYTFPGERHVVIRGLHTQWFTAKP